MVSRWSPLPTLITIVMKMTCRKKQSNMEVYQTERQVSSNINLLDLIEILIRSVTIYFAAQPLDK